MRVLVAWPPHVPSYFNAGHHLSTFTIAGHLRRVGHEVDALDAGALNCTWKEFGDRVFQNRYDAVVILNEFDVVEGVRRAVDYCRQLVPDAVLVTAGRLSSQVPGFFRGLGLDAVVATGDHEAGVEDALAWAAAGRPPTGLPGVAVRAGDRWLDPSGPGRFLPAEDWVLPDVDEIPYGAYEALYRDDANRFCGIPHRRELVVPVARGCPVGCDFCDVPVLQGLRERRLSVERTIEYVVDGFTRQPFEYVAFYAPTFTLDQRWVRELAARLSTLDRRYPWKCSTTLHHLDEQLVEDMARSGCIRISVGVETLDVEAAAESLPRLKQRGNSRIGEVIGWCDRTGIELNCFVIVGLPGTTPESVRRTARILEEAGARVRPTLYTPFSDLRPDMTERQVSSYNRQVFADPAAVRASGYEPVEYLDLIFGRSGYVTPAVRRVAEVVSAAAGEPG